MEELENFDKIKIGLVQSILRYDPDAYSTLSTASSGETPPTFSRLIWE